MANCQYLNFEAGLRALTLKGLWRKLEKSDLVKTLTESRVKAASFWERATERDTYSADYTPVYPGAPPGYKPGDSKVNWFPDTSKWSLYYQIGLWPPPRGVILNTAMVYKVCKFITSSCRGHQYLGNFSKNGLIRPDVPPFGPAPIVKSNCLTFSPIHQQYYCLIPETVAREVGYLIKKKINDNTVRRYLFGFGAVTLGPKCLTTEYPIARQATDFEGSFDDDLDLIKITHPAAHQSSSDVLKVIP
ncbi:hypothetical protein N7488_009705 [Penicillium malachiteum]|nr:hypothetical protein N7488_009705 [Penicillium malachiteum]